MSPCGKNAFALVFHDATRVQQSDMIASGSDTVFYYGVILSNEPTPRAPPSLPCTVEPLVSPSSTVV